MLSLTRRDLLRSLGAAGTIGLAGCMGNTGSATTTLTWADHWPEDVVIADEGSRYFMGRIEEETNIEFDYHPGGELGGPGEFAELLSQDTIDVGPVSPQYTSDLFPLSQAAILPGHASGVRVHTNVNWDLFSPTEDGMLYEEEWADLDYRPLLPFGSGPMRMLLQGEPLEELDALEGQRIRSAGGINEWTIEAAGATPVSMDAEEGYTALERGTLDGNTAVIDGIYAFSFQEVTDYIILNAEMNHFSWVDTIRTGAWEDLSSDTQDVFNNVARETMDNFIDEQVAYNERIIEDLRNDMEIHKLSDTQLEEWNNRMGTVADEWLGSLDDQELGERAINEFESAVDKRAS